MDLKNILIFSLLLIPPISFSQQNDTINKTDKNGRKQGHWIKKYPDGHTVYNGYFKDNQPVGTFIRFFKNDTIHSLLIFNDDGKEAMATLYHTNGFIASSGKFVNHLKEGKWKFFSAKKEGCLMSDEEYEANLRNGASVKYYPDSSLAEKVLYVNDVRNGEWTQYFPDGKICLKANYINGKLNGSFSVFFDNGRPEYLGHYKDDTRDGTWKIYNNDGSLKYNIEYLAGVVKNSEKFKKESDFLDDIEKNKGKIADPEKTGTIW
jgi:antitoxin component YwqK of YwqJK toxin-antitoxin module